MKDSNKQLKETNEEFLMRVGLHSEGEKRVKKSNALHLFAPGKGKNGGKPCGVIKRK